MKTKSKLDPKVFYEHWKTPLDDDFPKHHYLAGILHATSQIYFFFGVAEKPFKKFHVMTLCRFTPFRIYQEQAFSLGLANYLNPRKRETPITRQSTWKFWNTPFIKEFDKGDHPLSLLSRKGKGFNVCHHVIVTSDEAVEFLDTQNLPRWEYYDNITLKKLVRHYATGRFHQWYKDWDVKNGQRVSIKSK